jgi:hypothetical protein
MFIRSGSALPMGNSGLKRTVMFTQGRGRIFLFGDETGTQAATVGLPT